MFGWRKSKEEKARAKERKERIDKIADDIHRKKMGLPINAPKVVHPIRTPEELHAEAQAAEERASAKHAPPTVQLTAGDLGISQSKQTTTFSDRKNDQPSAAERLDKAIGAFDVNDAFAMTVGAPDFPLGIIQRDLADLTTEEELRIKVARIYLYFDLMDFEQYLLMSWNAIWGDGKGEIFAIEADDLEKYPKLAEHFKDSHDEYENSIERMLEQFHAQAQSLIEGITIDKTEAYNGVSAAAQSSAFEKVPLEGQVLVFEWLETNDQFAESAGIREKAYYEFKSIAQSGGVAYEWNDAKRLASTTNGQLSVLVSHSGQVALFQDGGCTGYGLSAPEAARKLVSLTSEVVRENKSPLERISDYFSDPKNSLSLPLGNNGNRGNLVRSLGSLSKEDLALIKVCHLMKAQGIWDDGFANPFIYALAWGGGSGQVQPLSLKKLWEVEPNLADMSVKIYKSSHPNDAQDDASIERYVQEVSKKTAEDLLRDEAQRPEEARGAAKSALGAFMATDTYRGMPEAFRQVIEREVYQGSRWLNDADLGGSMFEGHGADRVLLGRFANGSPLYFSGEGSLLTVAPPGAGKTQTHVLPNLLNYPGSAVVLDIKGECYEKTATWRAENVGPVYRFAPEEPDVSNYFNPLDWVRNDPDHILQDSKKLTSLLAPAKAPTRSGDSYFEDKATDLLAAVISYVVSENDESKINMGGVLDLLSPSADERAEMLAYCSMSPLRSIKRLGNQIEEMESRQRESVYDTARSFVSAWEGQAMERITSRSDWSPYDFCDPEFKGTLYICVSQQAISSLASLMRTFIGQHINALIAESQLAGQLPALFMLDELPQLGYMEPVVNAIEVGRSAGIRLWGFCQSLKQIRERYGDEDRLTGIVKAVSYMNPEAALAEKLSRQLGTRQGLLDGEQRPLVTPQELSGPEWKNHQLVLGQSMPPALIEKWMLHSAGHPFRERVSSE